LNRKRTYASLLLIMLLQSLLLLRVLSPAVHTVLHGVNDVGLEERTALCDISDEASSNEEPQKSASSVQFSVVDMLASSPSDFTLKLPTVTQAKVSSAIHASLPAVALPGNTPPPQC
jgi:hypothetical protein